MAGTWVDLDKFRIEVSSFIFNQLKILFPIVLKSMVVESVWTGLKVIKLTGLHIIKLKTFILVGHEYIAAFSNALFYVSTFSGFVFFEKLVIKKVNAVTCF